MPEDLNSEQQSLRLVSAAAHDLKTPLVFIRGAASQLNERPPSKEELARQLERIEQSAARLLNLIDSLIGSAQTGQADLPLEPVQAEQVIQHAIEDIGPYARQLGFSFKVRTSRRLPPVLTHRLALRRVLFNLLDNALKYTQDSTKDIEIQARRDGDKVRLSVRDWGVGVRGEDMEQIFKLFGRAAEPAAAVPGSSGLGLYIVSNLSQSLSAELGVRSQGQGSTFYLRLPVASQLSLF